MVDLVVTGVDIDHCGDCDCDSDDNNNEDKGLRLNVYCLAGSEKQHRGRRR